MSTDRAVPAAAGPRRTRRRRSPEETRRELLTAGLRILVDRDGWLRARGRPDDGGWRDEDLVCRTNVADGAGNDGAGSAVAATIPAAAASVSRRKAGFSTRSSGG